MAANSWDEPFLRTVAVLQLNQQLVDQKSDQLTELADMQAQRRINSDLAEYVAAHAKYGTIPAEDTLTQERLAPQNEYYHQR